MQVTLETIVTAQQTSAHAGPRMGRSAVIEAVVSVGSANAQSLEPLGRRVRSAQPAQTLAALRGKGLLFYPQPQVCLSSGSPSLGSLLCLLSSLSHLYSLAVNQNLYYQSPKH